jgi:hypothetical protein
MARFLLNNRRLPHNSSDANFENNIQYALYRISSQPFIEEATAIESRPSAGSAPAITESDGGQEQGWKLILKPALSWRELFSGARHPGGTAGIKSIAS